MSDSETTSEQQARLSRLLAEARVDEPMPPDVAARLDRVLAGLGGAEPVDLAARRRRRRAGGLLVAAAAVVVVGLGLGELRGPRSEGQATSGDSSVVDGRRLDDPAADGADPDPADPDPADPGPAVPNPAGPGPSGRPEADNGVIALRDLRDLPRVREQAFARDAARIRELADRRGGYLPQATGDRVRLRYAKLACRPAAGGRGSRVVVRYDSGPAALVFQPPRGETQVADLLACDDGELLASVTLPRRTR